MFTSIASRSRISSSRSRAAERRAARASRVGGCESSVAATTASLQRAARHASTPALSPGQGGRVRAGSGDPGEPTGDSTDDAMTLGVEEEFQLLDARTGEVVSRAAEVLAA